MKTTRAWAPVYKSRKLVEYGADWTRQWCLFKTKKIGKEFHSGDLVPVLIIPAEAVELTEDERDAIEEYFKGGTHTPTRHLILSVLRKLLAALGMEE